MCTVGTFFIINQFTENSPAADSGQLWPVFPVFSQNSQCTEISFVTNSLKLPVVDTLLLVEKNDDGVIWDMYSFIIVPQTHCSSSFLFWSSGKVTHARINICTVNMYILLSPWDQFSLRPLFFQWITLKVMATRGLHGKHEQQTHWLRRSRLTTTVCLRWQRNKGLL